jgi:hypothetical protein
MWNLLHFLQSLGRRNQFENAPLRNFDEIVGFHCPMRAAEGLLTCWTATPTPRSCQSSLPGKCNPVGSQGTRLFTDGGQSTVRYCGSFAEQFLRPSPVIKFLAHLFRRSATSVAGRVQPSLAAMNPNEEEAGSANLVVVRHVVLNRDKKVVGYEFFQPEASKAG